MLHDTTQMQDIASHQILEESLRAEVNYCVSTGIPEGWVETTLGEVCEIKYGKDHKDQKNGTIPCFGSGGFMRYVENSLYDKPSVLIPRKGTISNLFFLDIPFWTVDTLFYTRINEAKVVAKFLFYKLKNEKLENLNVGSAVPSLTTEVLNEFPLLLPPLPEQQAIARMLSSFDNKINLLREQNETLEKTAQTIFHEWFGKYSPERLEELPEGWRVGKLNEIADITSGKRPGEISNKMSDAYNIPLLGASKIMGYIDVYLFDGKTLIIGRVGTHGEIQRFNEKIFPSDNTLVLKSDNFIFVYQILKNIDYVKMNRGAVQPLITQTDLKNYEILIPDDAILRFYKEVTNPIFDKIDNNNSQIKSLSQSQNELLSKLINGVIRICNSNNI